MTPGEALDIPGQAPTEHPAEPDGKPELDGQQAPLVHEPPCSSPNPEPPSPPLADDAADRLSKPPEPCAASDPATPELTLFVNAHGPLTKEFKLDAAGMLAEIKRGYMRAGTAMRRAIADVHALAQLIGAMASEQALAPGSMRVDMPAQVRVTTKDKLNSGTAPDVISRSRDFMTFTQRRGFVLIDFDRKGITAEVQDKLTQSGGLIAALATVLPELKDTGYVERASTSAGLFRTDTGQRFPDSGGIHLYLQIEDVSDTTRFLNTLHDRCWLAGLGWYWIGKTGALLERSIVDRAVGTPEHLCFEGPPPLGPGLAQNEAIRMSKAVNGGWLDTRAACPPLNALEQSRLKELQTKAAVALRVEASRVREGWLAQRTTEIATRHGITEPAARRIADKHVEGVLTPLVELTFADPTIGVVMVGDVLAYPDKHVDEPLADPWEGPSYGRQTAKVLRRPDGSIFINSFAHGGQTFELKLDFEAIGKILSETDANNAIDTMIRHVLTGSLDPVERDMLARKAAAAADVKLRPVQQKLKAAQEAYDQQRVVAIRATALANRTDPRPQHTAPAATTPWLPEMKTYDDILGAVTGDIPPTRHIENELNCVRCTVVPGTHAFSSDRTKEKPPAPQWNICKLDNCDVANLLETHIDFTDPKTGFSVQCPPAFVDHYRQWHGSTLPKLVAVSPLPLVLGNGEILAPHGLDRLRGIAFIIDEKLRECLPTGRIRDVRPVAAALDFLVNEWLVDVKCPFTDKCTAIALVLTIIERSLLEKRPVGFIDAPGAEHGKTILAEMIIAAATGLDAVASTWSLNEEERRKALLAIFDAGLMYVLWDNIPNGALISCPHVERSCTTTYYADRKLGVSELIKAAAATIHIFTGINVGPEGAMATRALRIRVDTELVDPMARAFVHNNPVAWTKANREKILGALYTIMLGNPMLDMAADMPSTIRFQMWYRLVGSAIEHATRCYKEVYPNDDKAAVVEFEQLFAKQKMSETEGVSLTEMLDVFEPTMEHYFKRPQAVKTARLGKGNYFAKQIAACLNRENPPEGVNIIRGFLFQKIPSNAKLSPHTVARALGAYKDKWRILGEEKLVLRIYQDSHTEVNIYRVERVPVEAQSTGVDVEAQVVGTGERRAEKETVEKEVVEKGEAESAAKFAELFPTKPVSE
jgi:hypothetical protein